MKRVYKAIDLPDRTRHVAIISLPEHFQDRASTGLEFIKYVVEIGLDLLQCGPLHFQKLTVEKGSDGWTILAEATQYKTH